jgi:1,4-alpha-glucan branching enzyme
VPHPGAYSEIFNSDSHFYQGGDVSNGRDIPSDDRPWMGRPASLVLTLPPLAGLVLQLVAPDGR